MLIECPNCQTRLKIDENKIPDRGATAKCPKCGGPIRLEKPEKISPPGADRLFHCPRCGFAQEKGTECISCGVVFKKIAPPPGPESAGGPQPFHPDGETPLPPAPSRMLPAVLTTIFCCQPTGVAALIFAARVKGREAAGDYEGARRASRTAGILCLVSLVMGMVLVVVGLFFYSTVYDFLAGFTGSVPEETEMAEDGPAADGQKPDNAFTGYARQLKKNKTLAEDLALRSDFINLRNAQQMYYMEHGTYSSSIGGLAPFWRPNEKVEIEILAADDQAWSARGRYRGTDSWVTYNSND